MPEPLLFVQVRDTNYAEDLDLVRPVYAFISYTPTDPVFAITVTTEGALDCYPVTDLTPFDGAWERCERCGRRYPEAMISKREVDPLADSGIYAWSGLAICDNCVEDTAQGS